MDRFETTRKVGIIGIIGNVFLLVIKGIVGILFNSQAMIADAANSASDIFSSVMTTIGNKIAGVPRDKDHNFGHGKAEYIFSLLISLSMAAVAIKLLYNSVVSLIAREELAFSWTLVLVCIVTIVTKLILYLYFSKANKKYQNVLIKATMIDQRNDCILTLLTTLSIILAKFNIYWFDGIAGIIIALWIFITGVKIFSESYNILMDKSLKEDVTKEIEKYIEENERILGVKSIYSIPTGYKYVLVITINVDGEEQTSKTHKIADKIQDEIKEKFEDIDEVIVHVEPQKEEKDE